MDKNVKKVLLASPFLERPDFNQAPLMNAAITLRIAKYEVFSPLDIDRSKIPETRMYEGFLQLWLIGLQKTDAVVALEGWMHSQQALLIITAGIMLGKKLYNYEHLEECLRLKVCVDKAALFLEDVWG